MTEKKPMISLTLGQHMALLVAYRQLAWDIQHKTKSSPSLKNLNRILGQSCKTKTEMFNFIHDMFEYNNEATLDICGMGDCPGIKQDGIASRSVGKYQVTWQEDVGLQSEAKKLCQDCKDYLVEHKMIEDVPLRAEDEEK